MLAFVGLVVPEFVRIPGPEAPGIKMLRSDNVAICGPCSRNLQQHFRPAMGPKASWRLTMLVQEIRRLVGREVRSGKVTMGDPKTPKLMSC